MFDKQYYQNVNWDNVRELVLFCKSNQWFYRSTTLPVARQLFAQDVLGNDQRVAVWIDIADTGKGLYDELLGVRGESFTPEEIVEAGRDLERYFREHYIGSRRETEDLEKYPYPNIKIEL